MSDKRARIHAQIPVALKEQLRQADGSITENLVEALEIRFGESNANSRAAVERQLERYREQRSRARQTIQNGEEMLQEAEEGIERLEQRLEMMKAESRSYSEDLDELLEDMEAHRYAVTTGHGSLQRIAADHGKPESEVLEDLRERSDLNHTYFTAGPPEDAERQNANLRTLQGGED